jgi:hypothetical protein
LLGLWGVRLAFSLALLSSESLRAHFHDKRANVFKSVTFLDVSRVAFLCVITLNHNAITSPPTNNGMLSGVSASAPVAVSNKQIKRIRHGWLVASRPAVLQQLKAEPKRVRVEKFALCGVVAFEILSHFVFSSL